MIVSKLHGREGNWTLVPKRKPSQGTMLRKKKSNNVEASQSS